MIWLARIWMMLLGMASIAVMVLILYDVGFSPVFMTIWIGGTAIVFATIWSMKTIGRDIAEKEDEDENTSILR